MKKILLFIGMIILLSSFGYAALTDGLELYYSFDSDKSAVVVDSTGHINGTYSASNSHNQTNGILGKGLNVSLYGYTSTSDSQYVDLLGNWSISLWVKPNPSRLGNRQRIIEKSTYGTADVNYNLDIYYNAPTNVFGAQTFIGSLTDIGITNNYNIVGNNWYHVLLQYNKTSGTANIYINGILNDTKNLGTGVTYNSAEALRLGADSAGTNYPYNGMIDEFAIYNRTITPTEIAQLYNGGTGYNPYTISPNLQVNWNSFSPLNNSVVNNGNNTQLFYFNYTGVNANLSNCSFNNNTHVLQTLNNLVNNTMYNFSVSKYSPYVYNISYYVNCSANNGILANSSVKILRWNLTQTAITLNLTNGEGFNKNFVVKINATSGVNETMSCDIYSNVSSPVVFDCPSSTVIDPTLGNYTTLLCSIYSIAIQENVSIWGSCTSSGLGTINSSRYNIYLDNVNPIITIHNWTENKTYFRKNITGNFTFSDPSNLFRFNVSIDGISINSSTNLNFNSINYLLNYNPINLKTGKHTLYIEIADGHTANSINNYEINKGGLFDDSFLEFDTNKAVIKIEALNKYEGDIFNYEKKIDRYSFSFKPEIIETRTDISLVEDKPIIIDGKEPLETEKQEYIKLQFKLTSDKPIYIINKPDTIYKKWLITGNNWIDFMNDKSNNDIVNYFYDLSEEGENRYKTVIVEVFYTGDINKDIIFNSIGDLNIVNYTSYFYTINATVSYENPITELTNNNIILTLNFTNTLLTYNNFNSSLRYNNTLQNVTKTNTVDYLQFTSNLLSPSVNLNSNISFYWNISFNDEPNYIWYFNQTINFFRINNCNDTSYINSLTICGFDEINPFSNVTTHLNINFDVLNTENEITHKFSFKLNNKTCYNFCITPNTTSSKINSKMEYGDGVYTDRKYYLVNFTIDNTSKMINLYHLNTSISSDIILTVYDKSNGQRVQDAYIKILRYYPGEDNGTESATYRTVEVEKSDVNGQTLAKMVLADVWYKFIIEYPYGTILLNSDVQKILSIDKLLPIIVSQGNLLEYNKDININGLLECDWIITKTCSFTWSNPEGTAVTGTLIIQQDTGYTLLPYYKSSLTSSTGSIAYTIPDSLINKVFTAEGWIKK